MKNEEIIETIKEYKNNININKNFEKIEKHYRKTVYSLIKKNISQSELSNCSMNTDDVYQECLIILIKVLDKFDIERNICFSTYYIVSIKNKLNELKIKINRNKYKNKNYELKENIIINRNNEIEKVEEEFDNKILYNKLINILKDVLTEEELVIYLLRINKKLLYKEIVEIYKDIFNRKISISKICLILKRIDEKLQKSDRIKAFESENKTCRHIIGTLSLKDVENTILHTYQKDN